MWETIYNVLCGEIHNPVIIIPYDKIHITLSVIITLIFITHFHVIQKDFLCLVHGKFGDLQVFKLL